MMGEGRKEGIRGVEGRVRDGCDWARRSWGSGLRGVCVWYDGCCEMGFVVGRSFICFVSYFFSERTKQPILSNSRGFFWVIMYCSVGAGDN